MEFIINNIVILFSAILSGSLGIKIYDYIKTKKKKTVAEDFFNDTKDIINIIEDLVTKPNIDRVLMFRGGNGGSVPKLGKDYFVKAVFEAHKVEPPESMLKTYNSIIPDSHYITMLLNLMQHKLEIINIDQLPDCLLKQIYIEENILYSEIFLIHQTEEYMFYVSVATKNNGVNFRNQIMSRLHIDSSLSKLKTIFVKHYKKSLF